MAIPKALRSFLMSTNKDKEITYSLGPPPEHFDGFGFFKDALDGTIKFTFFDDIVKQHGPPERDPELPTDRETYHVVLTSVRKATIHLEAPFTSNFIDAFTYARHIAHSGFSGIMLRKSRFSLNLLKESLEQMFVLYSKGKGFVYCDETGTETFYQGNNP